MGVPPPHQDWMGVPPVRTGWGTLHWDWMWVPDLDWTGTRHQNWMGVSPNLNWMEITPIKTGWEYQPVMANTWTGCAVGSSPLAVSCRRTFLSDYCTHKMMCNTDVHSHILRFLSYKPVVDPGLGQGGSRNFFLEFADVVKY